MLGYALWGLVLGVVINHLANKLPARESPLGAPTCPNCDTELTAWQWSGIVATLTGRRSCPGCEKAISLRAPLVELICAALFGYLFSRYGPSVQLGLFSLYSFVFILVFVIDLETRLILNVVMLPAILMAIAGSFFRSDINYLQSLVGGATGFVLVLLIYLAGPLFVKVWSRMRGQTTTEVPFGFGDVMLSLYIGLVVGFPAVIFALFIGIFGAGIGAVAFILYRASAKSYSALTAIPYGPFLVIGGMIMMLYGPAVMGAYLGAYG